jgi:beta-ribofuranosylaminobenzene 5'-phosphate synthase
VTGIVISAPARLHFGMLDPAGIGARRYGGFGVGVEYPRVLVRIGRRSDGKVAAAGLQSERAAEFARRARSFFALRDGVQVNVLEAIPPHSGLGSGTKLGLAIARGVAELAGASDEAEGLAAASGRGARSSVGSWTFAAPGLVVEAGALGDSISPLVARYPMPDGWRCVLAIPLGVEGLSGKAEERFFGELEHGGSAIELSVSRVLLTQLLPALLAADIDEFGVALSHIQREMGWLFAGQQGGIFHPRAAPLVDALLSLGVGAVGQSSWGPAVYGIVDNPDRAGEVAEQLRAAARDDTAIRVVDFDRHGAVVARDGSGSGAAAA